MSESNSKTAPAATRAAIKAAVERRMKDGEPFTCQDLFAVPEARQASGDMGWRTADATLQSWRKKGLVSFVRIGRQTIWTLTESGRALS